MVLRNINFGYVLGASGVQGYFGEGYPYHWFLKWIGLGFLGMTFVSKTTTFPAREGNMPLNDDLSPKEIKPSCIHLTLWTWFLGVVLNAVGLSGPGAKALFEESDTVKCWQSRAEPFFISFMALGTFEEKMAQVRGFAELVKQHQTNFKAPFGLQINLSCPNAGNHSPDLVREALATLDELVPLGVPIMIKLSVTTSVEDAALIAAHSACDALCVSNTVPWGKLPDRIDWKRIFGTDVSPLAKFGGGGLSGEPLLKLVCEWVTRVRAIGITKPINAGGGILCCADVDLLKRCGADSVFIGSITMLRPWRVQRVITHANTLFQGGSRV